MPITAASLLHRGVKSKQGKQPFFTPRPNAATLPEVLEDYPVARRDPAPQGSVLDYLDRKANVAKTSYKTRWEVATHYCGSYAVVGRCHSMHRYAKKINCGREWCELCREDTEARRLARWLPKVRQMSSMGYWVITIPRELAPLMRTKKSMRRFGKKVRLAFKKAGYQRGLTRWHFFGDKDHDLFPHLNVLVDGKWIHPGELEDLKTILREKIYPKYLRKRYQDKLVVNYSYRDTPAKIMHTLKYVARATFLQEDWDKELAEELFNFRNCAAWGKWDQAQKWDAPHDHDHAAALADLANGICPVCKTKITWDRKPTPTTQLLAQGAVQFCGGYYLLPKLRAPPGTRSSRHRKPPANHKA